MIFQVQSADEVGKLVSRVKSTATEYCTNFYPTPAKLQNWVRHAELWCENAEGAVFFLRKDRGFTHLSFCAKSRDSLKRGIENLPIVKEEPFVLDLVGAEAALVPFWELLKTQGFSLYQRLFRMTRTVSPEHEAMPAADARVVTAAVDDCQAILDFLLQSFDCRAEQIPMLYEIRDAVDLGKILVVRQGQDLAGLLFFETQGMTSTLRYWLVDRGFRDQRIGAALMSRWFLDHPKTRRQVARVTRALRRSKRGAFGLW